MSGVISFDLFRSVKLSSAEVQRKLSMGLPGPSAQWLMAPANRPRQTEDQRSYTRSAVLVLLLFGRNEPEIVFIRRASYDGVHSGQIGFPGGKFEPYEHHAAAVALREANEETGIKITEVDILGALSPLHIPVSKMLVEPVLAFSHRIPQFVRNKREVDEIMIQPMDFFLQTKNLIAHELKQFDGETRKVPAFNTQPVPIWGATAMIMSELLTLLYEKQWLQVAHRNFNKNQ
jgi:8-oxo-dGTP pyrophosphatase MutT (NUDIX family)